jgi:hypothetical protein
LILYVNHGGDGSDWETVYLLELLIPLLTVWIDLHHYKRGARGDKWNDKEGIYEIKMDDIDKHTIGVQFKEELAASYNGRKSPVL